MANFFGVVLAIIVAISIAAKYYLGTNSGFALNFITDLLAISVSAYVSWLISEQQNNKTFQKNIEDLKSTIDDKLDFISEFAQRRVKILSNRIVTQANQLRDLDIDDKHISDQIHLISRQISMLADDAEATHMEIGAITEKDQSRENVASKELKDATRTEGEANCPHCGTINKYILSVIPNSRAEVSCQNCKSKFFMHRSLKGKANISFDYIDRYGAPQRTPAPGDRIYTRNIPNKREPARVQADDVSLTPSENLNTNSLNNNNSKGDIVSLSCATEGCDSKIPVRFGPDLKDNFRQLCFICQKQNAIDIKTRTLRNPIKCEPAIILDDGLECAYCSNKLEERALKIIDGTSFHRCFNCLMISSLS